MPSLVNILLLVLVFVTVGFVGGALVAVIWSTRLKREEQPNEGEEPAARKIPSRLQPLVELFRLRTNQQIVVSLDGKYYSSSSEMEERQLLMLRQAAEDWERWLGIEKPPQPVAVEEKPQPEAIDIDRESEARLNEISAAVPVMNAQPAPATVLPGILPEVKPKPTTIVGQVNEILQEKLAGSNKTISLVDDMHRGVIVWVGLEKFDGIDAVPYPEAQKIIREAVKEWEKRTENGTL
jgi:hypothetical protein